MSNVEQEEQKQTTELQKAQHDVTTNTSIAVPVAVNETDKSEQVGGTPAPSLIKVMPRRNAIMFDLAEIYQLPNVFTMKMRYAQAHLHLGTPYVLRQHAKP